LSSDTNQRLSHIEDVLRKAYATHAEETRLLSDVLTYLTFGSKLADQLSEDDLSTLKQKVTSLQPIERKWWLLSKTIRD